jgi:LysM repeat protein
MIEKGNKVTGRILKKAHDALNSDAILAPTESKPGMFLSVKKLKPALAGGALVLLLALGFLGYKGKLGENLKGWMYGPGSPEAVTTPVKKPLPPVPEVKSEEISKPPEVEIVPGLVIPLAISPAQESLEVLPKEGEFVENKDARFMKIDEASPSLGEPGRHPAPPEETQANAQIPNTNGETTQSQTVNVDEKITIEGGNQNGDAQDLLPGEKALGPSDFFTLTVKKGEALRKIAARWFPEDPAFGEKSILSANPLVHDKNRILAGQILRIPKSREAESKK